MTRTTAHAHVRRRGAWQATATARRPEVGGGAGRLESGSPQDLRVTLLELVAAVSSVTDDEREIVATVVHMLRSGSVTLCGIFRGTPPASF